MIGSWLLDLTAAAMQESPDLSDFAGRVSDSGEGRWTSIAAIDEGVPAPVLTTALYERFFSRGLDDFGDKVLSAMRKQFGGHDEKDLLGRAMRRDEVFADDRDASRRAAELIAAAGRPRSTSAASSPGAERRQDALGMVGVLGDLDEMPWERDEIFQVDERVAPPGDEARNLTHLVQILSLYHQAALRPMPVTSRDLDAAAAEYEAQLPEQLDFVHLGLGPDGHTASLVPDDPVLEVDDRRVAMTAGEYQGHRRMTLTYPELAAARQILWLIFGEKAREPLAKLLAGDRSIPAGRVENEAMVVVADEEAAGSAAG